VEETLIDVGMFLLRLGLPLAVTLGVGYWLRRLDAKWQAEALARWEANDPLQKEIVEALKPIEMEQFCRKKKEFAETRRTLDPDCALLNIPCWVARLRVTGQLPKECYNCELFAASLVS
jgi:hypothetical protein